MNENHFRGQGKSFGNQRLNSSNTIFQVENEAYMIPSRPR